MGSSSTPTTGAEALAAMLDGYGVTHFFMVPAVLRRTMAELERSTNIARIPTHGEKSAVYMADGYARISGRPGLCGAQAIGAMNLAAGLREPWLAHSPVIAITGGRDPKTKYKGVYQEVDDFPSFAQVTKFNATVDDVARIPDMVRQAFREATCGMPGPVHLEFRGNEGQIDAEKGAFDARVESRFTQVPPLRPAPSAADMRQVVKRICRATRPVIVAGGGIHHARAQAELVAVAEALSVPVATSLNGRDSILDAHPLSVGVVGTYSRECANAVVGRADLVVFVGSAVGGMTTNFWSVPRAGTPTIQIDIIPENIGRNYDVEIAVNADAKTSLAGMLNAIRGAPVPSRRGWLDEVNALKRSWREASQPLLTSEDVPVRPERLCHELSALVPDDGVVIVDTGHAGMWMGGFFDLRCGSQSYLRSCGHLGWAFPAGLGAKCAAPDRPVIVFTGDGGFWYHVGELETACRWGINSITVVNNNCGGNQSKRGFDRAYGGMSSEKARELWTYSEVNFALVAESMGALGIRVNKPAEFQPAMERALEAGRPVVIDVRTDIGAFPPLPAAPV